jgi:hypothetical protein
MKLVIALSLILLCVAGVLSVSKPKMPLSEAPITPQAVRVINNLSTVQVEDISVSNGLASFNVVNISSAPLNALSINSGRYRIIVDSSYWDRAIVSGEKLSVSLNIDGGEPLTIEALVYQSGNVEGDQTAIQRITDTRDGHKIAMRMIQNASGNEPSIASFKAAVSALNFTERQFRSSHVYQGANDARNNVLDQLSRIEALEDQEKANARLKVFREWVKSRAK